MKTKSPPLDHEKIAQAVKATLVDPPHGHLDFLIKEVELGTGRKHGAYVCTYLGFHIFKARRGINFFHIYCEPIEPGEINTI